MAEGAEIPDVDSMDRVETLRWLRHGLHVQNYALAASCLQRFAQFPQTGEQRKTREALGTAIVERERGQTADIGAEWADFYTEWFDRIGNPILSPSEPH